MKIKKISKETVEEKIITLKEFKEILKKESSSYSEKDSIMILRLDGFIETTNYYFKKI